MEEVDLSYPITKVLKEYSDSLAPVEGMDSECDDELITTFDRFLIDMDDLSLPGEL